LCNVPWTAVTFLPFAKIKIKEGHVMGGISERGTWARPISRCRLIKTLSKLWSLYMSNSALPCWRHHRVCFHLITIHLFLFPRIWPFLPRSPPLNFPDCRRVPLSNSGARKSRYTTESFVARAVPSLFSCCMVGSSRERMSSARRMHVAHSPEEEEQEDERESPSVLTTPPVMCWARHFHDWTWLTYNWIKRNRIPFHVGVYVIDIAVFEGIRSTLQFEIQISSQQQG
jgi:hypothetical protein